MKRLKNKLCRLNNFKNKGAGEWNKKGKSKWKGGRSSESTNGQDQYDHDEGKFSNKTNGGQSRKIRVGKRSLIRGRFSATTLTSGGTLKMNVEVTKEERKD